MALRLQDNFKYNYPDDTIFFLHIGKTGGQTINQMFRRNGASIKVSNYGKVLNLNTKAGKKKIVVLHTTGSLCRSLKNTKIIFFFRDPVERFISAFYYLKVKAKKPLLKEFDSVNDLAEAWNSSRADKIKGHIHYTHLFRTLSDYMGSKEILEDLADSLFFVGDFNNFAHEVEKMCNKIGIRDCKFGHKNSYKSFSKKNQKNKYLSEQAENNLKQYFAEDYEIIKWIKNRENI